MSLTPVANDKIFNQKNFNNFVGTPLDSRVNIYIIFAFKFTLRYPQPDINLIGLPPVSTILLKLVAKFAAGVVDTGGQP